jgi:general secretion pathway protein E
MPMSFVDTLLETFEFPETVISDICQITEDGKGEAGRRLVDKKLITERQLLEVVGRQYALPVVADLPLDNFDTRFTNAIPIQFLKRHLVVPLMRKQEGGDDQINTNGQVMVAVNNPSDMSPVDDLIRAMGGVDCQIVLSTRESILSAINILYDLSRGSAEDLVETMEEDEASLISEIEQSSDLLDDTSDAPIIKLVNHVISQAIKARASDIHIEPYQDSFKIRQRVDGILYDMLTPPKRIQASLVARIKVMAKMKLDEKRLPQDSRINLRIGNQEIDIRVSTLPTVFGERVVLRLLNKSTTLLSMTDLGLDDKRLEELNRLISAPNGIFLVTGPTGSGKTTTLYAVLSSLNKPDINIITIEDPVEYQITGVNQIQVNRKIDLTFAAGLRSIVRQDPDVILVGEIRDRETADIAIQSALTGHLVFSTLHTNDAASAITRLVDIGAEPFLISSSVIGVAAQRLIRVLCKHCKEPFQPDEKALRSLGITRDRLNGEKLFRAKGCPECFHTGYSGRLAIFEIMVMGYRLQKMVLETFDAYQIKNEALQLGMVTLREDGIQKVLNGISTIEEVLRVTQRDQALDL